jgi:hypothetical protein
MQTRRIRRVPDSRTAEQSDPDSDRDADPDADADADADSDSDPDSDPDLRHDVDVACGAARHVWGLVKSWGALGTAVAYGAHGVA